MAANAPKSETIPVSQAASLVMLTPERLRQLAAAGYIPRAVKGRYPLVDVVQGYIRFLKDEERRTSKVQAESGLKAARQREVELRIAREEARLVEMEDVEATVSSIFATLRAELSGVPAAVTRDHALRDAIEKAHNAAFARSQGKFREACEALRAGRDPLGADGTDDA